MREPMCYGDDLPTAEDLADEIRSMRRLIRWLAILAAGMAGVIVWCVWRMV